MNSEVVLHFARHAGAYAEFRPHYPRALFDAIVAACARRERACDCGSGSGQALAPLARAFTWLVASDPALAQVALAGSRANVGRIVARAEALPFAQHSFDLIAAGQALHWFDLQTFFNEAARVLRPRGVVAAWCYGLLTLPRVLDGVLREFHDNLVGPYWPPARRLVDEAYASIAWPWPRVETHRFAMARRWSLDELVNYIGTWSCVGAYRRATGRDPIPGLQFALRARWGQGERRAVRWPLTLKLVRLPA
jgi:SAM-dependent methyltransferase